MTILEFFILLMNLPEEKIMSMESRLFGVFAKEDEQNLMAFQIKSLSFTLKSVNLDTIIDNKIYTNYS